MSWDTEKKADEGKKEQVDVKKQFNHSGDGGGEEAGVEQQAVGMETNPSRGQL